MKPILQVAYLSLFVTFFFVLVELSECSPSTGQPIPNPSGQFDPWSILEGFGVALSDTVREVQESKIGKFASAAQVQIADAASKAKTVVQGYAPEIYAKSRDIASDAALRAKTAMDEYGPKVYAKSLEIVEDAASSIHAVVDEYGPEIRATSHRFVADSAKTVQSFVDEYAPRVYAKGRELVADVNAKVERLGGKYCPETYAKGREFATEHIPDFLSGIHSVLEAATKDVSPYVSSGMSAVHDMANDVSDAWNGDILCYCQCTNATYSAPVCVVRSSCKLNGLKGALTGAIAFVGAKVGAAAAVPTLMSTFGTIVTGVGTFIPPGVAAVQSFAAGPFAPGVLAFSAVSYFGGEYFLDNPENIYDCNTQTH